MTFDQLGLSEPILRAIREEGYDHPSPIQTQAIPPAISGRDMLGSAQTGTGKTAAFAIPMLERFAATPGHRGQRRPIRALVLCPTRELAAQIDTSIRAYGRHLPLRAVAIYGGVNQNPQVRALRAGVDILIATPGRLFDLIEQGYVDLRQVQMLVLDEADQMLDMGFIHDIRRIVAKIPKQRQTLMFSATMPPEIRRLADSILTDPVRIAVNPVASTVQTVEQQVYFVTRNEKSSLLRGLLRGPCAGRTLVFTRTKHGADRVVRDLLKAGFDAKAIHGNKSQNARTSALEAFKSRRPPVLVATDIAARGIDVDDVAHVINFDLPQVPETYVHRIGRTARAGASGIAVSFCDPQERGLLQMIERLTGKPLSVIRDRPPMDRQDASRASVDSVSRESRAMSDRSPTSPRNGQSARRNKPQRRRAPSGNRAAPTKGGERSRSDHAPQHGGKSSSGGGAGAGRRNVNGRNAPRRGKGGAAQSRSSGRGSSHR